MNKIIITGRCTRDPELRTMQDNVSVCTVTVAVDRRPDRNGERHADFIPCVFWRSQAEFVARYFTKGSRIAVSGRIQVRTYEDSNGNKRTTTEIVADDVEFVDPKQTTGQQDDRMTARQSAITPDSDISLPFDLDP